MLLEMIHVCYSYDLVPNHNGSAPNHLQHKIDLAWIFLWLTMTTDIALIWAGSRRRAGSKVIDHGPRSSNAIPLWIALEGETCWTIREFEARDRQRLI